VAEQVNHGYGDTEFMYEKTHLEDPEVNEKITQTWILERHAVKIGGDGNGAGSSPILGLCNSVVELSVLLKRVGGMVVKTWHFTES
jgi:hypothetical protein